MNKSLVSERYASALFELASERNLVEEVYNDSRLIISTCEENRELRLLLGSPIVNSGKKLAIVRQIFQHKIHHLTLEYMLIMVRKKREGFLQEVAIQFTELYLQFKNILTVHFHSACMPTATVTETVSELMKKYTSSTIDLRPAIDESVIGGFILRWKDKQYDASIRREIENLRNAIAKVNLYKKEL